MNAAQWTRVKELFHRANECAPADRATFLAQASGGDAELRAEVERLLAAHADAGGFIEQSPVGGGAGGARGAGGALEVASRFSRTSAGGETVRLKADTTKQINPAAAHEARKRERAQEKKRTLQSQKLQTQVAELEARIAEREQAIRDLEAAMAEPRFYEDRTQAQPMIDRHQALMWEVGDLMHQWEELVRKVET